MGGGGIGAQQVRKKKKLTHSWWLIGGAHSMSAAAIPGSNTTSFMLCYDVKIIGISHNDPGMLQGHCVIL